MYLKSLFIRASICGLVTVAQCNSLSSQTSASTETPGIVSRLGEKFNNIGKLLGIGVPPIIPVPACCRDVPITCTPEFAVRCPGFQSSPPDLKDIPHWRIGPHPDPNIANPDGPPCCYAKPRPDCVASVAQRCGGAARNISAPRGLPWWIPGQTVPEVHTFPNCCRSLTCANNNACPPFANAILKRVDFETSEGESITLHVLSDLNLNTNFISHATIDRLGLSGAVFRLNETDTLPVQVAGADEILITQILEANLFTGREQYAIFGVLPPLPEGKNEVADIMLGIDFVKNAGALHVDPTFFSGHKTGDGCYRGAAAGHQEL